MGRLPMGLVLTLEVCVGAASGVNATSGLNATKVGRLAAAWDPAVGPAVARFASFAEWFALAPAPAGRVPLVKDAALPLFVIAGAQKGGTTFLRKVLNEHPMLDAGRGVTGRCGGEIHVLDGLGARLWDKVAADPGARVAETAKASREYTSAHFSFPTCRGVARPAAGARPVFFFDTSPFAVVGASDRPFAAPEQLRGTGLVLGASTAMVLLLRDPVARYRSGLAMSRCASLGARRLAAPSKYHDRFAGGMAEYLAAFAGVNATVTREFRPLWRSRYRILVVRARRAVASLVFVKSEAFFAAPVDAANGLLATLGLPTLALDPGAIAALRQREADCDVRPLFSPGDAALVRSWLAADGALDLEDLGPDLAGFRWPGDPFERGRGGA